MSDLVESWAAWSQNLTELCNHRLDVSMVIPQICDLKRSWRPDVFSETLIANISHLMMNGVQPCIFFVVVHVLLSYVF